MTFIRFFHPNELIWAWAAVSILVFYVVRLGGRGREVSSYMLWQRAFARRTAWRKWQTLVSLVVAQTFLALVGVSLTHSSWSSAKSNARTVVLIVDTSASMNATDVEPTRFSQARTHARQHIRSLRAYERMAVLSAGSQIRVHCPITSDRRTLHAALDQVLPTEGVTRIEEAVQLARRMLKGEHNPRIVVFTDGAFAAAEDLVAAEDVELLLHHGGGALDNVGITRVALGNSLAEPLADHVLVEVGNFGSEAVQCQVELGYRGAPPQAVVFELAAEKIHRKVVPVEPAGGGLLVATLTRRDQLMSDNRAQLLVPPRVAQQVTLVAESGSPLEKALRTIRTIELSVAETVPDEQPPGAITVIHRRVPQRLPPGPVLVIEPAGPCELWELDEPVAGRVVVRRQSESPLLAGVDLTDVVIEEAVRLKFLQGDSQETAAATEKGIPILSLLNRPDGRGPVIVLHVRLDKSDLVLREAFPVLLANAIRRLSVEGGDTAASVGTGQLVHIDSDDRARQLRSPDGRTLPLAGRETIIGPLDVAGVWRVLPEEGSPEDAEFAVAANLTDRSESDLRSTAGIEPAKVGFRWGGRTTWLWMYFVGLALVVTTVEWVLFHRQVLV